jgi:hypothetical protein
VGKIVSRPQVRRNGGSKRRAGGEPDPGRRGDGNGDDGHGGDCSLALFTPGQ